MFRPREAKPIARKHVCFPCSDTTEIKIITTLNMKQKMKKLQGLPKTNIYIYIYIYIYTHIEKVGLKRDRVWIIMNLFCLQTTMKFKGKV